MYLIDLENLSTLLYPFGKKCFISGPDQRDRRG